jgi:hypothetical protein
MNYSKKILKMQILNIIYKDRSSSKLSGVSTIENDSISETASRKSDFPLKLSWSHVLLMSINNIFKDFQKLIFASRYRLYLPSKQELIAQIEGVE